MKFTTHLKLFPAVLTTTSFRTGKGMKWKFECSLFIRPRISDCIRRVLKQLCILQNNFNSKALAIMADISAFSVLKWWILICFFSEFQHLNLKVTVEGLMNESRLFMSGKVLRVIVAHVITTSHTLKSISLKFNNLKSFFQYPPAIIATKQPDGTYSYTGTAMEELDYLKRGLNIS